LIIGTEILNFLHQLIFCHKIASLSDTIKKYKHLKIGLLFFCFVIQ